MIKKRLTFLSFCCLLCLSLITSSCYYDNEETLYPDAPCDTTQIISYAEDIVPLLSVNCYNCHGLSTAAVFGEGLVLEGYANLKLYNANFPEVLVNSVKQNGLAKAMPRGSSKLDKCSISDIEVWIKQGEQNN
jgi:hypothetical protein